eukprot:5348937-Pyramimonas_sp.AAC.1
MPIAQPPLACSQDRLPRSIILPAGRRPSADDPQSVCERQRALLQPVSGGPAQAACCRWGGTP